MTRTQIGLAAVALVAVVLAVVLVTRNGSESSDRDAVEQVMSDLQSASRDGDGQRICSEIFTPKLSNSVTRSSATGSCASEVKAKLFSADAQIEVQSVDVQTPRTRPPRSRRRTATCPTYSWSSRTGAGASAA